MTSKIIVTVNEGKIRGIKNKSMFSGTEFFSFYGVPYGQPTGKTARFKDPIPVKPWKNIYDATEQKDGCAQSSMRMKRITGSEDCLYNNIHTPKLPSSKDPLKAVIVNIHPGGFLAGSPETNYYGSPEYIMQNDIVYISIGYRLHFLGFLNLGVEECSGNQALKDIVLGLKWIKNNITAFGGDPENVTLIGSSTGAIMINSLMLSPRAKGLFHKAILMGGFLFFTICPIFEENQWLAIKYAQAYGYEKASASEKEKLLSYYKRMHLSDLVPTYAKEDVAYKLPPAALPCSSFNITLDTAGEEPIFPVSPRKLVDSIARIPVMFGVCEKEAIMGFTRGMKEKVMKNFKTSFCRNSWSWAHHMTDEEVEAMFEEIKSFYLNGKDINDAPIPILSDIQSDGAYSEIYEAIIDVISAELPSSAYVYEFQFESTNEINTLKDLILPLYDQPIEGAYHACDYSYWACTIYEWEMQKIKTMSNRTRKMITTFTKLLTTFAKTGDPNYEGLEVEWKPSTPEEPCHLTINDSLKLVDGKINDKRMRFWDSLRKKYGKQ